MSAAVSRPTRPIAGTASEPRAESPAMRPGYRTCRYIAQIIYATAFRGRAFGVQHIPRAGGVLLVANHQSFFDPILATLAVPRECSYMARDSLFTQPAFRRIIEYFDAFPVRRGAADMRAIRGLLQRLRNGRVVAAFPEGTRTWDGTIGPMRGGTALVARKARVPMVPTVILGAYEAWPRQSKLMRPHPIIVAYDRPLYPHLHKDLSDDACIGIVRDRILAMQQKFQNHPLLAESGTSAAGVARS